MSIKDLSLSGLNIIKNNKTYTAFTCSVIGASHIKNGKPCQDASYCENGKKYRFIAVADGHGGEPYFRSGLGSRFAVEVLRSCVLDNSFMKAMLKYSTNTEAGSEMPAKLPAAKERERLILQLKKSVISRWNMVVAADMEAHPFTEEELSVIPQKDADKYRAGERVESAYGTTLIAVLWTDTFLLALQIGDGTCVILNNEAEFSQPVPADENCFLNVTTSLCDKNAIDSFRHYFTKNQPAAVLIATDGVDDCFAGAEKLYDFYRVVLSSFNEKDEETAKAELKDYFPRLSETGSGDDVSIGIIIDRETLFALNIEAGKTDSPVND